MAYGTKDQTYDALVKRLEGNSHSYERGGISRMGVTITIPTGDIFHLRVLPWTEGGRGVDQLGWRGAVDWKGRGERHYGEGFMWRAFLLSGRSKDFYRYRRRSREAIEYRRSPGQRKRRRYLTRTLTGAVSMTRKAKSGTGRLPGRKKIEGRLGEGGREQVFLQVGKDRARAGRSDGKHSKRREKNKSVRRRKKRRGEAKGRKKRGKTRIGTPNGMNSFSENTGGNA